MPAAPVVPGVAHHQVDVNGTRLHYVTATPALDAAHTVDTGVAGIAAEVGSPVLLVHGFPETWWAFRDLIPLLAAHHRVFAVDLRGFGDSDHGPGDYDSTTAAEDLHQLIAHLGVGPVHLVGQDISGATVFRLAATHPEDVMSFTGIETGLPGFGLEALADVARGGAWYIGLLTAPGVPEMLLAGREREFLGQFGFPAVDDFVRTYSATDGWRGAAGLYRSALAEGEDIRALAEARGLRMPVLAVGSAGGSFTADTLTQVARGSFSSVLLEGVGHYVAQEAPEDLAKALLPFFQDTATVSAADRRGQGGA